MDGPCFRGNARSIPAQGSALFFASTLETGLKTRIILFLMERTLFRGNAPIHPSPAQRSALFYASTLETGPEIRTIVIFMERTLFQGQRPDQSQPRAAPWVLIPR